jgi:hypothetical protein
VTLPKFFEPMTEDKVRAVPQFNDLAGSLSLDCPACSSDAQLNLEGASTAHRQDGYAGKELRVALRCICGAANTLRIYEHKGTVQLNWVQPVALSARRVPA